MTWSIEFGPKAQRQFERLDREVARRILRFLLERIAPLENPRAIGEALAGAELGSYWKYRVGDYRIIASIEDAVLRIVVVRVAHRRDVYR